MGKKMEEDCAANPALKDYEKEWVASIWQRNTRLTNRMEQISGLAESTKEKAVRKSYAEIDAKRNACIMALRCKMCAEKKSIEEFFDSVAKDGSLSKSDFVKLAQGLEDTNLDQQHAETIFSNGLGDDATSM